MAEDFKQFQEGDLESSLLEFSGSRPLERNQGDKAAVFILIILKLIFSVGLLLLTYLEPVPGEEHGSLADMADAKELRKPPN